MTLFCFSSYIDGEDFLPGCLGVVDRSLRLKYGKTELCGLNELKENMQFFLFPHFDGGFLSRNFGCELRKLITELTPSIAIG